MSLRHLAVFAVLLAATPSAPAATYRLDDQHCSVLFAVNHLGFSDTYGMFGRYSGTFDVDMRRPQSATFAFTIDAASLDTKSAKRDEHLRSPDFFNVKQFPEIAFRSRSVRPRGKTLLVTGDLSLHGVTRTVQLPLTYRGEGKGPYGNDRIGFDGKLKFKRSDFGMATMVPAIGDDVTILVSFEGIKQ